jgi:predicted DNA-binding transcriptional regulator AlpA
MTGVDDGLPKRKSFDRLINGHEADHILGTSRSGRYERQRTDPDFPKPVKLGKLTRYSERECLAYVAHLLAKRGAAA